MIQSIPNDQIPITPLPISTEPTSTQNIQISPMAEIALTTSAPNKITRKCKNMEEDHPQGQKQFILDHHFLDKGRHHHTTKET